MATTTQGRGWLERLGAIGARRRGRVSLVWLSALIVLGAFGGSLHAVFSDNVTLSGTQANTGLVVAARAFPGGAASTGVVVFSSTTALTTRRSLIESSITRLSRLDHVRGASDPLASPDLAASGRVGYSTLGFDVPARALPASLVSSLESAVAPVRAAGVAVSFGGGLDQITQGTVGDRRAEAVGFLIALAVLLLVFGSVVGAALPLIIALVGVGVGLSALDIVASGSSFSLSAPKLAVMIGLGVGIDYAVFMTTRFRQLVSDGLTVEDAAARTTGSSGRAIVTAAATVSAAMLGLYASGLVFIGKLGLAAVLCVASAALAAVTLVPALLAVAGGRIDRWRVRSSVAESGESDDGWHRYAAALGRHPWRYLVAGLALVALIATPTLRLETGHVGDGAAAASFTGHQAYETMAEAFGPGINGPLEVVVSFSSATSATEVASALRGSLAATSGVAEVGPVLTSPSGTTLSVQVIPTTGPQSAATSDLFDRLVDRVLPRTLTSWHARGYVTGETGSQIQFDQLVSSRLIIIIAVVVLLAFALILLAFRSLLLALKAALLNLASIAAADGVLVAVFEWGWGRSWLGLSENVPIEAYVPMVLFAVVFGLSMDYEIFLLSRVKESWDHTHDNHLSVAEGLSRTGRVITAAALIMIGVFLSFVGTTLVPIKQLALGLAASVLVDATLIRLLLVPTTMYLFGDWNWWLPAWLDRILPHLSVEEPMVSEPREAR